MRETSSQREAEGSSLTHPTPMDQEFSLFLEINHVVFVLLYLKYFTDKQVENVRNYSYTHLSSMLVILIVDNFPKIFRQICKKKKTVHFLTPS